MLEFECLGDINIDYSLEVDNPPLEDEIDGIDTTFFSPPEGVQAIFYIKNDGIIFGSTEYNAQYWKGMQHIREIDQRAFKAKFDPDFAARAPHP